MDFVVVTHGPDLKLLRHFVASYELYYQPRDRLYVFASSKDRAVLSEISFPEQTTLVYREEYPILRDATAYSHQTYLKLIAHGVVSTEYYAVVDSDYLFVGPTRDDDFFSGGKPIWYFRPWIAGELPEKWRSGSEAFVSTSIDHNYADVSQWVYKRSVAAAFARRYDPVGVLNHDDILEQLVYGWYAHQQHADEYTWVPSGTGKPPVVERVNQIPPSYLHLDPNVTFSDYTSSKCAVFWSHWELAEQKMIEFLEASQRHHFGALKRPADRRLLLPTVAPGAVERGEYGDIVGADSDGWLRETVTLACEVPAAAQVIVLGLAVPGNPSDVTWALPVSAAMADFAVQVDARLEPGDRTLTVPVPAASRGRRVIVTLQLGAGFRVAASADRREFRARLTRIEYR